MIKRKTFALLFLMLSAQAMDAAGTWNQVFNYPMPARENATAFTMNGIIYFGTGYEYSSPTFYNDFWKLDPVTQVWTQLADYAGGGRSGAFSFGVGGEGYLGGGITDYTGHGQTNAFFKYSPVTNSWTDLTWTAPGPGYYKMSVFTINDIAYLVGGASYDSFTLTYTGNNYVFMFDPAMGYFLQMPTLGNNGSFPGPSVPGRYEAFAFTVNGKGYVGAGGTGYLGGTLFNDFYEFDPATALWTQKANFPGTARRGAAAFGIGNEGYAGGGCANYLTAYSDFYKYDPVSDSWSVETSLWTGLYNTVSFSIGNFGYLGSGTGSGGFSLINQFLRFTPNCSAPGAATVTAGGATSFCQGGSVTLTAATSGSGLSYQWDKNGNNISGATNPTFTATTTGNYRVRVVNACGSVTSNSISVTVYTIPVVTVSALSSLQFCNGGSVDLKVVATSGTTMTYQWRKNGVNISGATAPIYNATTAGTYSVAVSNVCGITISGSLITTVYPAATGSITASGPVSFCLSGSVTLNSTVTGSGSFTYQWRNNNVDITGATASSYTATATGSYDVRVIGSCNVAISNAIIVSVATGLPQVPASITGPATFCANQQGVAYTASPVPGYVNYFWSLPTGASVASGAGTNTITVNFGTKGGNVRVKTINSCGASNYRSKKVTKVNCRMAAPDETEIDEVIEAVKVFPNPANDKLYVEFSTDVATDYTLKLKNLTGQIIYNGSGLSAADGNELTIDVNELPAGIYMLILDAEGITNYKKVVIR